MIDIRLIREDPKEVQKAISSLGADAPIDEIARLDDGRRDILQELEAATVSSVIDESVLKRKLLQKKPAPHPEDEGE